MSNLVSIFMLPFQIMFSIYVYLDMLGDPAFVGIIGLSFQLMCNIVYAIYYAR